MKPNENGWNSGKGVSQVIVVLIMDTCCSNAGEKAESQFVCVDHLHVHMKRCHLTKLPSVLHQIVLWTDSARHWNPTIQPHLFCRAYSCSLRMLISPQRWLIDQSEVNVVSSLLQTSDVPWRRGKRGHRKPCFPHLSDTSDGSILCPFKVMASTDEAHNSARSMNPFQQHKNIISRLLHCTVPFRVCSPINRERKSVQPKSNERARSSSQQHSFKKRLSNRNGTTT